ncbi:hypothetical protein M427DRAFT_51530 [Gonapodya prolifera JEL478]|uniref:Hyaluronan/mRNA-binding protein domain-containing protein n=1 Tax=Gonapodya prolifera (strain JEL478) TaxID=1344416 RepID=A0A139AXJ3_GONPJ|nr:hypothetical protein M427DRAFT_51530 [Gonapodya prolifera JEL478]|eukprot:KXS21293.1 hypothetical protein M427DRAFT_51530 [Gonapodya prolifera JEL478]
MTRSYKSSAYTDRHISRNGVAKRVKKDGAGKGNWGRPGDELQDPDVARDARNLDQHAVMQRRHSVSGKIIMVPPATTDSPPASP